MGELKIMTKKVFIFLSMTILSIIIVGCSSNSKSVQSNKEGAEIENTSGTQEIVVALTSDPIGLSPIETWDSVSDQPITQMYERLVIKDLETGEIVPQLAISWDNVDDTTWEFDLRDDVVFHDGTKFNAEAVEYTFKKFIDPETAAPGAHIMSFVENVEAVDEYRVRITTKGPNPNVLTVLTNRTAAIISPTADQNQNLMQNPVGTGPFKFESWVQGDKLTIVKNEDYWDEVPQLDRVTFLTVPDESTAISMLQTGEVQMVNGISSENISRVEGMDNVELLETEGTGVYFLSFNMEKEPMNELEFRQAVAHAIDVDSYLGLLNGLGFKSYSLFGPKVAGYDPFIEEFGYKYDPEKAKSLVEDNGYDQVEVTLYTTSRPIYSTMADVVEAQLSEVGLNVKIELMEWGTLLDTTAQGEHDMYTLSSTNTMNGLETLYGYFHSDSVGANNRAQYSNKKYDEIVDAARSELDDKKNQQLVNEAHQMLIEEAVLVPMHHSVLTIAHDASLQGVILPPEAIFELKEAYRK